jgi:hypothetical protein
LNSKLKHVDTHPSWIRQEVKASRLNVKWVDTDTMLADGMTKILGRQKHAEFLRQCHGTNLAFHWPFTEPLDPGSFAITSGSCMY